MSETHKSLEILYRDVLFYLSVFLKAFLLSQLCFTESYTAFPGNKQMLAHCIICRVMLVQPIQLHYVKQSEVTLPHFH